MQIKKNILALVLMCVVPFALKAQSSSTSVFSPFTVFGIGEVNSAAPTVLRSMGGAGVAYSSPLRINYLNPASNGAVMPNTFLLSIGGEGGGYYLSSSDSKTSGNTFSFTDLAIRFPLTRGLGVSLSLTPYSSVGYSIGEMDETSYTEEVDYNGILNTYSGEGGVSQMKLGLGATLFKNFSVGADFIYYFGTIARSFNTIILTDNLGNKDYPYVSAYTQDMISSVSADFGFQYLIPLSLDRSIIIGGTYKLGGTLGGESVRVVPTNNEYADNVEYKVTDVAYTMPWEYTVGFSLRDRKYVVLADYTYRAWEGTNDAYEAIYDYVKFTNTHQIKIGGEYTPNRYSLRNFMSRLTYRVGASYSNNYLELYDTPMSTKTITFGVGVPLRQSGLSSANVSVELGQSGSKANGLFKQQYFKISVGLNFFGEDQWFVKQRFN